jgi:hypothetical protein
MYVNRLELGPEGGVEYAYWTLGVVDVFTAPAWLWYSAVIWPRPLNRSRTWSTTEPPVAAS